MSDAMKKLEAWLESENERAGHDRILTTQPFVGWDLDECAACGATLPISSPHTFLATGGKGHRSSYALCSHCVMGRNAVGDWEPRDSCGATSPPGMLDLWNNVLDAIDGCAGINPYGGGLALYAHNATNLSLLLCPCCGSKSGYPARESCPFKDLPWPEWAPLPEQWSWEDLAILLPKIAEHLARTLLISDQEALVSLNERIRQGEDRTDVLYGHEDKNGRRWRGEASIRLMHSEDRLPLIQVVHILCELRGGSRRELPPLPVKIPRKKYAGALLPKLSEHIKARHPLSARR